MSIKQALYSGVAVLAAFAVPTQMRAQAPAGAVAIHGGDIGGGPDRLKQPG
jgi:hypothetical protein